MTVNQEAAGGEGRPGAGLTDRHCECIIQTLMQMCLKRQRFFLHFHRTPTVTEDKSETLGQFEGWKQTLTAEVSVELAQT